MPRSVYDIALRSSPDPDTTRRYFTTLRERQPAAYERLAESRLGGRYLTAIFSHSHFLSEEVLQNPQWVESLMDDPSMHRLRLRDEFVERLEAFLPARDAREVPDALWFALFRREQILRVMLRDVLGFATLSEVTEELSSLADAILQVSYMRIRAALEAKFGVPMNAAGIPAGMSVVALGKLGGCELNYSSDIDLMFVYAENGETAGPQPISNKEFFKKLSNHLTELLSTHTPEGLCYRVDLRLRPEGRLGEVCISVDGARHYYEARARDWELQMLIKARVAAGEPGPGRALLEAAEDRIYSTTLDFTAVESMSATRDRIDEKLAARRGNGGERDVKLARGGIRDIEFLVQCLQRLHGGRVRWVRNAGTLLALSRLHDKNLLSPTEYGRLASAYEFLRHLEHRLQMLDDRQTHTLPSDPEDLDRIARRMPAGQMGSEPTRERLLQRLNEHLEHVVEIYERVIHAQRPVYYTTAVEPTRVTPPAEGHGEPSFGNLLRSLDQTAPALASGIAGSPLKSGLKQFEHFLERAVAHAGVLEDLESAPALLSRTVDLFEHSPYFAEQLIRDPRLLQRMSDDEPAPATDDADELRGWFRREVMRLMAASVCDRTPIFDTLGRMSDMADEVITAAYRMALRDTMAAHAPVSSSYAPSDQMLVIALGRLGMREFDLASDADLVFTIPDSDASETLFWTRVAERTIAVITAYTGEGVMFAVDTRLRPNGREGPLVQTAGAARDYFAKTAEAWEGIAWMKARAIAGNADAASEFLHEVQEVDWRRYGQSGRSRENLRQMRMKLEKEQGAGSPLKAGRGGYYDIDFALMYLRLKGAGMFFKVLNTPQRIEVIEKMGHLSREDAAFFGDAAVFYRAVDHALRIYSGQAEGSLPGPGAKLATLERLVRRWTPDRLNDEPLPAKVGKIRAETRRVFDRIFR